MRSSSDTYKNVAENCSQYSPKNGWDTFSNSTSECSCTTCNHFTKNAFCDIDLYDEIVENHDL
ncbi:hypothetical protein [Anaeromicropila herbilytica]|uniref:Uncharacterized protein n=1 Tax=Anaeromicropila herbilytica TaxID=2785025 RepID=A0A7R7IC20_9FIRM|nr:hypothetical protein [Anaeromicropila herbilytica]BCN30258.1 hypothetical protein bsdtb5_15530 [Anaeromicropila herbilytica]